MCSFKSIYFIIFILNLYEAYSEISDRRLCVDPECNEPVSLAKTLLRYSSPDPKILSFAPNSEVTIYSKEAGSETSLWGAVIKGKRGYIPKHLVREYKLYKKPTLLVDTELKQQPKVPNEADTKEIDPNNVKKSFEVVDGTTIYLRPQDSIKPSTTESPAVSTSLPPVGGEDKKIVSDTPKENNVETKENPEESLVDNVLSSFSTWMNDDADSEEQEPEDEEEEDEDDEEEDSIEEDHVKVENKLMEPTKNEAQDINLLINLPSGIKISPYNLEVNQSLNVSDNTSNEDNLRKKESNVEMKESEPTAQSNASQESSIPFKENIEESITSAPKIVAKSPMPEEIHNTEELAGVQESETTKSSNLDEAVSFSPEKSESETKNIEEISSQEKSVIDLVQEAVQTESQNKYEQNNVTENGQDTNYENTDSVTEPSVDIEDLQSPILDDVTTPNTLTEEDSKTTKEYRNESPPSVINEGKISDIPQTSDSISELLENLGSNTPANSENTVDGKKGVNSELEKNNIIISQNYTDIESINEEIQSTDSTELSEDSSIEEADETFSTDTDEITSSQEAITGSQEASHQESSKESINENIQEKVQNDEADKIAEVPSEQVIEVPLEDPNEVNLEEVTATSEGESMWSGLYSLFGSNSDDSTSMASNKPEAVIETKPDETVSMAQSPDSPTSDDSYCDAASESCNLSQHEAASSKYGVLDNSNLKFNSDFFILLITTAASVIVFLFIYMLLDRHKREAPLVARINKLEKEMLVILKENELLQEKGTSTVQEIEYVPNEEVEQLTQHLTETQQKQRFLEEKVDDLERQLVEKAGLEEQLETLEKELETSTEVGMELNRIISEMLDPTNGSDRLKENVEQLQRQLLEQKDTINSISETLQEKEAENNILRGDLERSKKIATDLQGKVDEMVGKILKIEKEKEQQQDTLQKEINIYQQKYNDAINREEILNNDIQILRVQLTGAQRKVDLKAKEYQTLKDSIDKIKSLKSDGDAIKSLLDTVAIRAEVQQLKAENVAYVAQLQQEQAVNVDFEKKYQVVLEDMRMLQQKYEQADKEKVEINSKLEVLNNYFKKRESELQEEIIKYKSIWDAKEGEATSTTERIKYMQEEIENYKVQNEALKQEIISQEIDLKSQISMLEKKVHENWVTSRQTERKLEDARQEAAQLRNRLTLRERAINEERIQNRLQSPVEQNGELPLSPHPIDSPASPPLLYGTRDHITKSPPIPGLPPFLPPPPGAPFMPPPLHGMPPFMPPLPSMFPGDHRPPPLGRMSSPPLNSRYLPESSAFSPYDRRSPSPPYDSEYGTSPPPMRGYSPYNGRDDRRDYKRPSHGRTNGRKGSVISSGSDHSNDSLNKINRKQSKMV